MINKYLLSSLACISFYTTQAQPSSKLPNIIFILADDIGYADFSCYGAKTIATPHIDELAAMVFVLPTLMLLLPLLHLLAMLY